LAFPPLLAFAAMPPRAKQRSTPPAEKVGEKPPAKEWKASSRHASGVGGVPAHAYNPTSGTFHMLDAVALDTGVPNPNTKFRSVDDNDDTSNTVSTNSMEYDSTSNNGSYSGESEDQQQVLGKDKNGVGKLGKPPGLVGPSLDKRDKIRWKNEKKHQRQKERRAKDLRDRATNHLMSRKLENLTQQLVAMGFSAEHATMAFIRNEGHIERSVAWLLEGGDSTQKEDLNVEGNLKIDIGDELARMAELEEQYKYSRPEIDRAVIACEGDLERATEWLRSQHPQPHLVPVEDSSIGFGRATELSHDPMKKQAPNVTSPAPLPQHLNGTSTKSTSLYQGLMQDRRDERELNPPQGTSQGHNLVSGHPLLQPSPEGTRASPLVEIPSSTGVTDWQRFLHPVSGRLPNHGFRAYPFSPPTPSDLPSSSLPYRVDSRNPILSQSGSSFLDRDSDHITGHLTERGPVLPHSPVMTPHSGVSVSANAPSFSPSFSLSNWKGSIADGSPPSRVLPHNNLQGNMQTTLYTDNSSRNMMNVGRYGLEASPGSYRPFQPTQPYPMSTSWHTDRTAFGPVEASLSPHSSTSNTPSYSKSSQPLTSGFLTGWGSQLSGTQVDWTMGAAGSCDYKTIDWSMTTSSPASAPAGVSGISSSLATILNLSEPGQSGRQSSEDGNPYPFPRGGSFPGEAGNCYKLWSGPKLQGGSPALGLKEKSQGESGSSSGLGGHEWTSPFGGKTLYTLPA
jgi:hypothetical protein